MRYIPTAGAGSSGTAWPAHPWTESRCDRVFLRIVRMALEILNFRHRYAVTEWDSSGQGSGEVGLPQPDIERVTTWRP